MLLRETIDADREVDTPLVTERETIDADREVDTPLVTERDNRRRQRSSHYLSLRERQ